jgi:hypothetical protein
MSTVSVNKSNRARVNEALRSNFYLQRLRLRDTKLSDKPTTDKHRYTSIPAIVKHISIGIDCATASDIFSSRPQYIQQFYCVERCYSRGEMVIYRETYLPTISHVSHGIPIRKYPMAYWATSVSYFLLAVVPITSPYPSHLKFRTPIISHKICSFTWQGLHLGLAPSLH